MRLTQLILFSAILSASGAEAIMYLHSGADFYGQGVSYPGYQEIPFIASFVAQDNTSQMASVFLTSTLFRPEFRGIKSVNRSDYYSFYAPQWPQYSFYPALSGYDDWSFDVYNEHTSSINDFMRADGKPMSKDYETPAANRFLKSDLPARDIEPHGDPDHDDLVRLLDDDELPGRPLL